MDKLYAIGTRVDLLAGSDNLAQGHLVAAVALETGQDTRSKGIFSIQVLLSEAVEIECQLLRFDVTETFGSVSDAKGVDVGLVVTTSLVGTDKELNHQVVGDIRAIFHGEAAAEARNATGHVGHQVGRRLEGLGDGHVAVLHVLEVDLPRDVNALGVLLPLHVHLVDVIGSASGQEVIVRVGGGVLGIRGVAAASRDGHRTASGGDLP